MGMHMLEKIYDEGRASMASQLAVYDEYDEDGFDTIVREMKDKYWGGGVVGKSNLADLDIETRCWRATEELIEKLHLSDETIGLPMPPLYQEVCMDPKILDRDSTSVNLPEIYEATRSLRKDALMRMRKEDLFYKALRDGVVKDDDSTYKSFTKKMLAEAILDTDERL